MRKDCCGVGIRMNVINQLKCEKINVDRAVIFQINRELEKIKCVQLFLNECEGR